MAISDEQIEEIRAKIDIADLVTSYGFQLKHSGSDLWCCCPFHTEKTPSFKVDSSRGTYHCFGCGESGDIFSFVQKQEGLSFIESVQKLAGMANVELRNTVSRFHQQRQRLYELMANLAVDFNKMLKSVKNTDGERAREYLKNRQIDKETVNKFLIGYAPKDVDKILAWAGRHGYSYQDLAAAGIIKVGNTPEKRPYFYFANRLVFAIKDKNGQVVAFSGRQLVEDKKSGKYVNSPETLIFKKSRTFFAFDEARKHIVKAPNREAIVCEGQIDCIRLHTSGFNTAVAPLGTAFTEDHAIMLHRVADTALLCFDDDGAGHKATIKAARILLAEGMPIRVLSLPDGDDPDSYILKHGSEAFGNLIKDKSESIVRFQIRAENSKEQDPKDSNALVRVTKAVLETIAKCRDKVLRNVLLKEAAKLLEIDYATLVDDIAKEVQAEDIQNSGVAEQLINSYSAARAEDCNKQPTVAEGALMNYLFAHEDNGEVRDCLIKLIPLNVLYSPMVRLLVEAWIKGKNGEDDAVQRVVESLSVEEYRYFLSLIANLDSTECSEVSPKIKMAYFARQIWHEYLVRCLKENLEDNSKTQEIVKALDLLHNGTVKQMANMIAQFPCAKFCRTA
jgi:DNA primase